MCNTLPKMLSQSAKRHPSTAAQFYRNKKGEFESVSFKELEQSSLDFAAGLLSLGVCRGECIGLISDNRREWQLASMGVMTIGSLDVPRGSDATENDLSYILSFSECKTVIVENEALLKRILLFRDKIPTVKNIILFDSVEKELVEECNSLTVQLFTCNDLLKIGGKWRLEHPNRVEEERDKGRSEDLACIIFTSGTTGEPKGVMLEHKNFMVQLDELQERIFLNAGDKALSVLPVWHAFERLCEYVILIQAAAICYSKPVGSVMLKDFNELNPHLMPAVPRVFEALYEGINRAMRKKGGASYQIYKFFVTLGSLHSKIDRILFRKVARIKKDHLFLNWFFLCIPWLLLSPLKALGNKLVFSKIQSRLGSSFRGGVSGGGALPPVVDEFFWTAGINVVEGYGMTETAPVICVRPLKRPVFGTLGTPLRGVEARIIDKKGCELPAGKRGVVEVRGGIVMRGYYKKPELTRDVISSDGWFNTGDLGLKTIDGELILKGRIKDTIVLRGGENVEPLPLEMKMNESRFIAQSVVLGQDKRHLGALIIPDKEELSGWAKEKGLIFSDYEELVSLSEVHSLLASEINNHVNAKNGFRLFERIVRFECITKPLEIGVELSAKQEIKRFTIRDMYKEKIQKLFV